jgi:hypothetical protein
MRIREVSRLNDGRAAEEGERRNGHPLVLNREQTPDSADVGFLEKFDYILRLCARLPFGLGSAWELCPKRFSLFAPFNLG